MPKTRKEILSLFDEESCQNLVYDIKLLYDIKGNNLSKPVSNLIKQYYDIQITSRFNKGSTEYVLENSHNECMYIWSLYSNVIKTYFAATYNTKLVIMKYNRHLPYNDLVPIQLLTQAEYTNAIKRIINLSNVNFFNDIDQIIGFSCQSYRIGVLLYIVSIFNKISNYYINKQNIIEILSKLSGDKIYTEKDKIDLKISEVHVNINGIKIPIFEAVSKDKYAFYSNNFDKYKSILEKQY